MPHTASLKLDDKEYPLSVLEGTEGEKAIDTRKLRADTGYICYDQGYGNTGSCESAITFLDGEKGSSQAPWRSRSSSSPTTAISSRPRTSSSTGSFRTP